MQVEFLNRGAEHVFTVETYAVPIHIERDRARKIVTVGVVVKFTHTTPGGKNWEWTTGVWLSRDDFRNADGSLKTKLQVAAALRDKAVVLRDAKLTEWNALDTAVQENLA